MALTTTASLSKRVFSQPTAPFREFAVRAEIAEVLDEARIKWFIDRTGNLIAGAESFADLKHATRKGLHIGLMAHMDHPGFHLGPRLGPRLYQLEWWGGAPFEDFRGAAVRLYEGENPKRSVRGTILKRLKTPTSTNTEASPKSFVARFEEDISSFSALSFGAFDFAGFERKGDLCHTRAADDLAGCVIALGALIDERRTRAKNKRRLFAIFTRAEEVGFIGCLDLLKRKELPARALYISLEASRTLPEAELGKGPVLRLGDRATLFDPKMTTALNEVALELSTERGARQFRYQRRLMPGGTCEGTALALHGYTTAALAVPLLNYHNQAFDGSRRGPRPEIISINDTDLARRFCFEAAQRLPRHLDSATRTKARIDRNFAQLKDRLSTDT